MNIKTDFTRKPSVLANMWQALWPPIQSRDGACVPQYQLRWTNFRFDARQSSVLSALCGVPCSNRVPIIFPQIVGFPLLMAAVTDPHFPEPIWRALQVRNRLEQYREIGVGSSAEFELQSCGHRLVERGTEFDFALRLKDDHSILWEGITTFYYRGRHGIAGEISEAPSPPRVIGNQRHGMVLARNGRWRYSSISGDYNGIHIWDWYARRLGFRQAIIHPLRAVGRMLALQLWSRLDLPVKLDLWFRGPLPYGKAVTALKDPGENTSNYAMLVEGERRPSLIASLTTSFQSSNSMGVD